MRKIKDIFKSHEEFDDLNIINTSKSDLEELEKERKYKVAKINAYNEYAILEGSYAAINVGAAVLSVIISGFDSGLIMSYSSVSLINAVLAAKTCLNLSYLNGDVKDLNEKIDAVKKNFIFDDSQSKEDNDEHSKLENEKSNLEDEREYTVIEINAHKEYLKQSFILSAIAVASLAFWHIFENNFPVEQVSTAMGVNSVVAFSEFIYGVAAFFHKHGLYGDKKKIEERLDDIVEKLDHEYEKEDEFEDEYEEEDEFEDEYEEDSELDFEEKGGRRL